MMFVDLLMWCWKRRVREAAESNGNHVRLSEWVPERRRSARGAEVVRHGKAAVAPAGIDAGLS